tara:strand:+ start:47 stop:655 length:609 start_codon:yes stop_codon:yes gene_type:complete
LNNKDNKAFEMMTAATDKTRVEFSSEMRGHEKRFEPLLNEIYKEMPVLGRYDFAVGSVNRESKYGGSIEFFSKDEPNNPTGKPFIELYANATTEKGQLKKAIWGDMLHHLSNVDPYWKSLRNEYMESRDEENKEFDRKKYKELVSSGLEKRSFEQWMDVSWADANVREPLKGNKEWLGHQTKKQKKILKEMKNYLRTGNREY